MHAAAREKIIGWYSTGPKLRPADLDINELVSKYCTDPVLLICQVKVCPVVVSGRHFHLTPSLHDVFKASKRAVSGIRYHSTCLELL